MPSVTKVVNIRGIKGDPKQIEGLVYVGRGIHARGPGQRTWPHSIWHNPFRPNTTGDKFRDALECVIQYADALRQRCEAKPTYLHELRRKLKGKYLGCWCCEWTYNSRIVTPCHGIPLACVAEGNEPSLVVQALRDLLTGHMAVVSPVHRSCVMKGD